MKIAIEAQRVYRKKKHGMDMVALELIKNLQAIDQQNEYVVFVKPDVDKCIPEAPNFKIVELSGGPYPTWEQIALPRAVKQAGCDMLHCTSNTAPIFSAVPVICLLHDIIYLEKFSLFQKGGTLYQKFGNLYRRLVVPTVARRSKRVVTVSNYEKARIAKQLSLGQKLLTIHNGVGQHFRPVTHADTLAAAKEKYNLPNNFVFFLGNTDPKKNTPNVLKAFADFRAKGGENYKLVMLDYDELALQQCLNDIGHPNTRDDIHLTGYVVNTDLPAIISQCKIFLYPSLRESFGIPILEGMACGVPVLTSNTSSMPEIAGDAAAIVDPHSPAAITQTMLRIENDTSYRAELCAKGPKRAAEFSWRAMAEANLTLYQDVYAEL